MAVVAPAIQVAVAEILAAANTNSAVVAGNPAR
jgi:hypothetical protein